MKKYLMIFFISLSMSGCDKAAITEDGSAISACGFTSFDQLAWAQTLISGKGSCPYIYKGATITMYDYKGEKVFFFENHASSLAICTQAVYNCSGAVIIPASAETKDWNDFETNRKNKKLLWEKL